MDEVKRTNGRIDFEDALLSGKGACENVKADSESRLSETQNALDVI